MAVQRLCSGDALRRAKVGGDVDWGCNAHTPRVHGVGALREGAGRAEMEQC
jgi:hypothetical protein